MVSDLADTYSETFIPIFYNLNGTGYQTGCGVRANFYGLQYVPRMWWGDEDGGSSSGAWNGDIIARLADPTDVTIDIEVFRGALDLNVRSTVCIEPGGTGRSMRLYFVQLLDYFPASPTYSRNAFRQVTTQDVTIAAGACVEVQKLMALKDADALQPDDIGVVVFAQEPLNGGPAEIYQTAFVFDPPGITADGFESGDTTGWE